MRDIDPVAKKAGEDGTLVCATFSLKGNYQVGLSRSGIVSELCYSDAKK